MRRGMSTVAARGQALPFASSHHNLPSQREIPAVHYQLCTGDVGSFVAGEKQDGVGDLFHTPRPPERKQAGLTARLRLGTRRESRRRADADTFLAGRRALVEYRDRGVAFGGTWGRRER